MSSHFHRSIPRRGFLVASAGTGAALALAPVPARATGRQRPFGRYGSPAARLSPKTLYVDPRGRGDHTSVREAVVAAGSGWTLVIAPDTYRETVAVDRARTGMTWIGASENPRDVVIVYDNAAGTPKPERCHFRTLTRTDPTGAPYGFVFAPSTAAADPLGYLVTRSRVSSEAPDGYYKLARPWVPSSDTTARPMLTVRDTRLGPGIDAVAPYADMSDAHPWQNQRFAEYRNTGPGADISVPANRPQLTPVQARSATRAAWLGDWEPWKGEC
ncbi:hypothetical protein [Streptomyces sp. NPDC093598]|uniref:hypothetical protein n=1 Tax=Streptomyces sp. NPDC093598 TaxID=3366046 RepID=UPI00381C1ABB